MTQSVQTAQREAEKYYEQQEKREVNYGEVDRQVDLLLEAVRKENEWLRKLPSRKEAYSYLGRVAGQIEVPVPQREEVITRALNDMYGYGKLQRWMDDELTSDIQVYGDNGTFVTQNGKRFESTEARMSNDELYSFITRKLAGTSYRFDLANPRCDAILPDGSRLHVRGGASGWTVTDDEGRRVERDCLIATIRKPLHNFSLEELQALGMFSPQILSYIEYVQRLGDGFVIGGDVGSGKSSMMAAMMGKNPEDSMSCIQEEMPELQPLAKWCARLYTRAANAEGKGLITMNDNHVDTLRMFFDNNYVGEVRTEDISFEFLQTGLTVTRQTGTTTHVVKGVKAGVERICLLAAGTSRSMASIGNLFSTVVRHVIITHKTKKGKRVTEIGYILPYDVEKGAVPFITVARWNKKLDSFEFLGVPQEMADAIEEEEEKFNLDTLPVQRNPHIQYVPMK